MPMPHTRVQVSPRIARPADPLPQAISTSLGKLRQVPAELSPHVLWAPLCCLGMILAAAHDKLWFLRRYHQFDIKATQELVGPAVLAAATGLALLLVTVRRKFWLGWLAALAGVLLCRELHFAGTSAGVYVGLLAVAGFGLQHLEMLLPFLRHRLAFTLLASAFATYIMTVSLDHGAWKFLPGFVNWGVSIEETLESCGHLLVLLAVAAAGTIRDSAVAVISPDHIENSR